MSSRRARRRSVMALALVVLAAGCVRTAGAVPAEVSAPVPEGAPAASPKVAVSPGGARAAISIIPAVTDGESVRATIEWRHDDEGQPLEFSAGLVAELRFTELERRDPGGDDDTEDTTAYRVDGVLAHVPGETGCRVAGGSCRVVLLEDADLVGLAVRHDDELTIELDWRTFGPTSDPSRPAAVVAIDLREFGYVGVADALESSGLIGTSFTMSLSGTPERVFRRTVGSLSAQGTLRVLMG